MMKAMQEPKRPGVMLYFDLCDIIRKMPMEDAYETVMAIADYAQNGVAPTFRNPGLTYAWGFIQQYIQRDGQRYDWVVEKNRKAAQKRWSKKRETSPRNEDEDASACT
mgnify:FL=1